MKSIGSSLISWKLLCLSLEECQEVVSLILQVTGKIDVVAPDNFLDALMLAEIGQQVQQQVLALDAEVSTLCPLSQVYLSFVVRYDERDCAVVRDGALSGGELE